MSPAVLIPPTEADAAESQRFPSNLRRARLVVVNEPKRRVPFAPAKGIR